MKHISLTSHASRRFPPIWSVRGQAVCFVLGQSGITCAIERAALELLESRAPLYIAECMSAYSKHRTWIVDLATAEFEERGGTLTGDLVLTQADVRFQIACEETDLPGILCV